MRTRRPHDASWRPSMRPVGPAPAIKTSTSASPIRRAPGLIQEPLVLGRLLFVEATGDDAEGRTARALGLRRLRAHDRRDGRRRLVAEATANPPQLSAQPNVAERRARAAEEQPGEDAAERRDLTGRWRAARVNEPEHAEADRDPREVLPADRHDEEQEDVLVG